MVDRPTRFWFSRTHLTHISTYQFDPMMFTRPTHLQNTLSAFILSRNIGGCARYGRRYAPCGLSVRTLCCPRVLLGVRSDLRERNCATSRFGLVCDRGTSGSPILSDGTRYQQAHRSGLLYSCGDPDVTSSGGWLLWCHAFSWPVFSWSASSSPSRSRPQISFPE